MNKYQNRCLVGLLVTVGLVLAESSQAQTANKTEPIAQCEPGTYRIDSVHTSVLFRINHLKIANLYGRFNEISGTVVVNHEDPQASEVDLQVKADSIDTKNEMRDKHLKSAEFFDVEKYPLITFKGRYARKISGNRYEIKGNLTLHGVTRPLTVKVRYTGAGQGMQGEYRAGFETTFTIKRSDFGMKTLLGPVGDEVRITVSGEGVRQAD